MNSNRPFLDNMFNQYLPSVYNTDNGMLNSNLFVIFYAYSEVFEDILRNITDVQGDVYIETATQSGLEKNFGLPIDISKPPSLNTVTNGGEIYRAILKTLYAYLLKGATIDTMDNALSLCLSILEVDEGTLSYETINNYTEFSTFDTSVQLTYNAVQVISGSIIGPAGPSQIIMLPTGLTVLDYDDSTKTVFFSGVAQTGVNYKISYFTDASNLTGTNWMNLTNRQDLNVSPMNLKAGPVKTYYNPEFSYWWGKYNFDGSGVSVDEFQITADQSSLVWRLPTKSIQYISPYTNNTLEASYQFYNESGLAYDINFVSDINPDALFEDNPVNYQNISANINKNYFVRYSVNNNGPNTALFPYSGSFFKYQKKYSSILFPSPNFGQLDFFQKGNNFDPNDLFGYGTSNAWLNVGNVNGNYTLESSSLYNRPFSLHERVLFNENFESGKTNRVGTNYPSGVTVTELVGTPTYDKNDCLMIASSGAILGSGSIFKSGVVISQSIPSTYGYGTSSGIMTPYGLLTSGIAFGASPTTIVYSSGILTSTYVYPLATGNVSFAINNGTPNGTMISGQAYALANKVELDFYDSINSGTNTYVDIIRTGSSTNYFKFRFGFETGNSISFTGSYSLSLNDTKPYEFVESYFANSGSLFYACVPSGNWALVSGNPTTSSSNYSLGTTGTASISFNVDNGTILDSDYIAIEYSDSLISTQTDFGPTISLSTIKLINPNNVLANDTDSLLVVNTTSTSFTLSGQQQVSAGINALTTNAYGSNFPVNTSVFDPNGAGAGPHKLEIIRNSGVYFDGNKVDYSTFLFPNWATDNIATFWANGNLGGDASNLSNQNYSPTSNLINNPLSVKISFPANVTLHHVIFGNKSLRDGAQNISASYSNNFTGNFVTPYFYQIFNSPSTINPPKNYLNEIPRNTLWSTLTCYFGVNYTGADFWFDEDKIFSSGLTFPAKLSGPSGLTMTQDSRLPMNEFSYFDNVKLSYFDDSALLPGYSGLINLSNDWQGSALDFNAVLDNKYLSLEPSPNFQFVVNIKGISEQFIPIVDGIVDKIKPAHTLAIPIFLFEQDLDTTSQVPPPGSDPETDWESGSILKNVQITGSSPSTPGTDSGLITPSGLL